MRKKEMKVSKAPWMIPSIGSRKAFWKFKTLKSHLNDHREF
jgi:hypothetical protein